MNIFLLGWQATLLDDLGTDALATLLGVGDPQGAEAEQPDCVLAVYPQGRVVRDGTLPSEALETFVTLPWVGKPNVLSQGHLEWPMIERVTAATRKPPTDQRYGTSESTGPPLAIGAAPVSLRKIIYQRRSAVALDGQTSITRDAFYRILAKTLAGPGQLPFNTLPWTPLIHLALFVHRVQSLDSGLYVLVRDPAQTPALRAEMKPEFAWGKPEACPDGLEFYQLQAGDVRKLSEQVSCHQSIAADGCFSLGMIAEFERPLRQYGTWFYPRTFWESGGVGQVLYLEAEAIGIRGTGIGCFFRRSDALSAGAEDLAVPEPVSLHHGWTRRRPTVEKFASLFIRSVGRRGNIHTLFGARATRQLAPLSRLSRMDSSYAEHVVSSSAS